MTQSLKNKNALITGSTSGIGFETAIELLNRGANVMFHGGFFGPTADTQRAEFQAKLADLKAHYPNQHLDLMEIDVTNTESMAAVGTRTACMDPGAAPHIDILVNSAGIQQAGPIVPTGAPGETVLQAKDFRRVMEVNYMGTINAIFAVLPYMNGGQIVNLSSVHGKVSSQGRGPYCGSKGGLELAMESIAPDLARKNIRINNVCPGFIKTPLAVNPLIAMAKAIAAQTGVSVEDAYAEREAWRLQHQGGKWIAMETVTNTIANLCDFTDSSPSGTSILLDNGYVDRTQAMGGAYFNRADRVAIDRMNERLLAQSQDRH